MKAGVERLMSDKMNYMAEQGHDITLVTYEQGAHPTVFPLHPSIKHFDLDTRFFTLQKYSLPQRLWKMRQLQKLFGKRLQRVVDEQQPDIIHATTYSLGLVKQILGLRTTAKLTMESQVSYESELKETIYKGRGILETLARYYDRRVLSRLHRFDAFFTLTKGDTEKWQQHYPHITLIPNPLTYYPETVKSHEKELHRIICAGRLVYQKGFDLFIQAFAGIAAQCPNWHVDLFGSGEDEQMLKELLRKNDLEQQIIMHPATDRIYDEFQDSDFFVFPSRFEGWGLVIVEAMSCGIPVVSFRCDYGPEDIITDGKDGLLVTNGDTRELGEKILWMVNHPEERRQMGTEARITARKYRKEIISQQWIDVFKSLLA